MNPPEGVVLVVEDEMLLRFELLDAFAEAGIPAIGASDGDEGARLLEDEAVVALVTDVRMPGRLDGIALAERAARLAPVRLVLICSGDPLTSLGRIPPHAIVATKPCASEAIVSVVAASLRGSARARSA